MLSFLAFSVIFTQKIFSFVQNQVAALRESRALKMLNAEQALRAAGEKSEPSVLFNAAGVPPAPFEDLACAQPPPCCPSRCMHPHRLSSAPNP